MTRQLLLEAMRQVLRPLGFKARSSLYFLRGTRSVTLVQPQTSSWGSCVYVNVGALPTQFFDLRPPKNSGHWALFLRASSVPCPCDSFFLRLELNPDQVVTQEETCAHLAMLSTWILANIADENVLIADIINQGSWLNQEGHVTIMLRDWANNKLGSHSKYSYPV